MLSRFELLEKEALAEQDTIKQSESSVSTKSEDEWIQKKNFSIFSPSSKKEIKHRDTKLRKLQKDKLVWAPCQSLKGGNSHIFAKICDPSETVTDDSIEWPIPENSVVVEYICPPMYLPQFAVVSRNSVHRFDAPIRNNSPRKGKENVWNPDRCLHAITVFKRRHTTSVAEDIVSRCEEAAEEFLSLALQLEEESKGGPTHTVAIDLSLEDEVGATDIDISQFALQKSSKGHRPALHAGDIVEYECPVFKTTKSTKIMKISPNAEFPLELQNSDIVSKDRLVRRIGSTFWVSTSADAGGCNTGDGGEVQKKRKKKRPENEGNSPYGALSTFRLIPSELQSSEEGIHSAIARQTSEGMSSIEEVTGVALNTGIGGKRGKKRKVREGQKGEELYEGK